jgi:hypothetical protein
MSKISRSMLQPIIQRVDSRLPGWVPRMLGSGARIQLINSVLSAIPNYFMACIPWDKASIEAIDRLTRAFLWKNKKNVHGGHCLIAWEMVTMPKKHSGLGIRNLLRHNAALLVNLTAKLLTGGTGPCFGWLTKWYLQNQIPDRPAQNDTLLWKTILKQIPTVQQLTTCKVSSGKSLAFWTDHWTTIGRFNENFSILYTFAMDSTCTSGVAIPEQYLGLRSASTTVAHSRNSARNTATLPTAKLSTDQ